MKCYIYILFIILLPACFNRQSIKKSDAEDKKIYLKYDYYAMGSDSTMYDIFYSIPYKQIIFNKKKHNFQAILNTNFNVINNKKQILSHSWDDLIIAEYFEDTKTFKKLFSHSIILPNGNNRLSLIINDYKNNKFWYVDTLLAIKEYNYLSNIAVYKKTKENLFEIVQDSYLDDEVDTVWLKFQLTDLDSGNDVNIELSEFGNITKNIIYNNKSNKINYLPISISEFNKQVKISARYKNEYREFLLRLMNNSNVIEFKELIGPIEYLLSRKDYINYVELDSLGKIKFIRDYWDEEYNSNILEEFYNRVKYVNLYYLESIDKGWKSDRGRIYILNGAPLSINHDFDETGEFEIWNYSSKKFIFINKYGIWECYMCN